MFHDNTHWSTEEDVQAMRKEHEEYVAREQEINRRRIRRIAIWATIALAISAFAVLVWPTRYRYDHMDTGAGHSYPVRINRFTGRTEVLYENGWEESQGQTTTKQDINLPDDQLAKLETKASIWVYAFLNVDVYNGSDFNVSEITVDVVVMNRLGKKEDIHRKDRINKIFQDI